MNDAQTIAQLADTDAYAVESAMPATAWSRDDALLEIERRITMQTQQRAPVERPQRGPRLLIAAAAFSVVVVALAAALLLNQDTEPAAPPTTEAPPTTQAAPPTTEALSTTTDTTTTTVAEPSPDPEALAFVEGLITELNAGDLDAVMARFPEDATFQSDFFTLASLPRWFEHLFALDSTFELGDCRPVIGGTTRCEWHRTSEYEPYYPTATTVVYQFRLEDGAPAFAQINHVKVGWWDIELQFMAWMAQNHPEIADVMYVDPDLVTGGPRFADPIREAELKREYVPLWLAATQG